jgi:hypothetical protein
VLGDFVTLTTRHLKKGDKIGLTGLGGKGRAVSADDWGGGRWSADSFEGQAALSEDRDN